MKVREMTSAEDIATRAKKGIPESPLELNADIRQAPKRQVLHFVSFCCVFEYSALTMPQGNAQVHVWVMCISPNMFVGYCSSS